MSDLTPPTGKRRSRRGREISDEGIKRLIQERLPPPPPPLATALIPTREGERPLTRKEMKRLLQRPPSHAATQEGERQRIVVMRAWENDFQLCVDLDEDQWRALLTSSSAKRCEAIFLHRRV